MKDITTDSWFKALKALKPIGVPLLLTKGMKTGTTYNITIKHLGSLTKQETKEVTLEKPDFQKASNFHEEMSNTKAKVALEEYAREFSIELNRQKSFANMLKDFKEDYNG